MGGHGFLFDNGIFIKPPVKVVCTVFHIFVTKAISSELG